MWLRKAEELSLAGMGWALTVPGWPDRLILTKGDKIVYMMFVDESGDPGYPSGGHWAGWGGSTHFARVGVIIHGWKWKAWNDRLIHFKRSYGLTW